MEIETLYHGTKFKKTADKILKEGFLEMSYFAKDLNTAILQGGKYVFEVAFVKSDLPDYWQVRCQNKISANRVTRLVKYKVDNIVINKQLLKKVFNNALKFGINKPYVFKDNWR